MEEKTNVESTPVENVSEETLDNIMAEVMSDDIEETPTKEVETEVEEVEETPTEMDEMEVDTEEVEEAAPFEVEITYNGENETITDKDQAVELMQKGKNYDKKVEQNTQLQNEVNEYKEIVELLGFEKDEFKEAALKQHFERLAEKNGTTAEYERKQYDLDKREKMLEEKMNAEKSEEVKAKEEQDKRDKMYDEFLDKYPDVKEIPDEVKKDVENGESLTAAYAKFENKELKKELKQLKKTVDNLKKAPVGATSTNGGEARETDPFLLGFDS